MRPVLVLAVALGLLPALACLFAPWVAPQDPFDPAALSLRDAFLPPAWAEGGRAPFWLGTDGQGRDLLSTMLYGGRLSILVALAATALGLGLGALVGVVAGAAGGWLDAVLMRLAEVQLTLPGILVAILVNGLARALLPPGAREALAIPATALAIGLSDWPQFARVARAAAAVEARRDFVAAARITGLPGWRILLRHVLPGVARPLLTLAAVLLPLAAIAEATLSFLGLGAPPSTPSLGTLIRLGSEQMFAGRWWIAAFPSALLVALALGANAAAEALRARADPHRSARP
ncbi:ABC transporter permease [Albimonas pacifica]|uniref:Peptide/nickel transport system permease protein n=1 Tax=Albimonas pacifica TaxID=1114924 RepID=A0A1I3GC27_9RHOB|nr:ABC transporter permease [Albimonas pacifica]SFI20964.1 peptide/nickel transport system permease protein [Albimonas pacifica]